MTTVCQRSRRVADGSKPNSNASSLLKVKRQLGELDLADTDCGHLSSPSHAATMTYESQFWNGQYRPGFE